MITNVYIDGFNLYYRALKDTPFRWLDLRKLAETLFPQDNIHRVCYFTARLDARPSNPGQAQRQLIYLRALATLSSLNIYFGTFRTGVKRRPLAEPLPGLPTHVLVRDSEEKGSDVNLATRLLVDGFKGEYEQAVVVSERRGLRQRHAVREGRFGATCHAGQSRRKERQPQGVGRGRNLRQAPVEEPLATEPASRNGDGRGRRYLKAHRVVTLPI